MPAVGAKSCATFELKATGFPGVVQPYQQVCTFIQRTSLFSFVPPSWEMLGKAQDNIILAGLASCVTKRILRTILRLD